MTGGPQNVNVDECESYPHEKFFWYFQSFLVYWVVCIDGRDAIEALLGLIIVCRGV